ncbi:MAG TPA: helix-turn-helix domain-containing protein, partial [Bradyrhizobium sp.]
IRYLNERRMQLVRLALLRADPAKTTVTQIAMDHDFWQLGHFSVAYRKHFGEPPSATLHQCLAEI